MPPRLKGRPTIPRVYTMPTKPTGRPRGRPPGVKNIPRSIPDFVSGASDPDAVPPPVRDRPIRPNAGGWNKLSPEERSIRFAKIRQARKVPTRQIPGKPRTFTNDQWRVVIDVASTDTKRFMKKMKDTGQLPDDPRAVEALEKTAIALKAATAPKDIAALARLMLDFTKAKPAQKTEVTVRTHEDFLDELAGDED